MVAGKNLESKRGDDYEGGVYKPRPPLLLSKCVPQSGYVDLQLKFIKKDQESEHPLLYLYPSNYKGERRNPRDSGFGSPLDLDSTDR